MSPAVRTRSGSARRVLLVGASVRAMAESAARAGYEPWALDAFGDLDLERVAHVVHPTHGAPAAYAPARVARAAMPLDVGAVAYAGGWENHPRAVGRVARGRELLGNAPAVLARVRDPALVADALRAASLPSPDVHTHGALPACGDGAWLVKRRASTGGSGVAPWRTGTRVPRGTYLQERIAGTPASMVFAADGRDAVPLAFTRQLVGLAAFGARGFRYCGSILAEVRDPELGGAELALAASVARELARAFGLRGLNGVDVMLRDGIPYVIEVNPRWTASMELVERARGMSMFEAHVEACRGRLPAIASGAWAWRGTAIGKAVLFATTDVVLGDTRAWLADDAVRDVPHPGERIAAGRPVCTIFARGATGRECLAALEDAAAATCRAMMRAGRVA